MKPINLDNCRDFFMFVFLFMKNKDLFLFAQKEVFLSA